GEAAWETSRQLLHRRLDAVGGRQRIRPWKLEDSERYSLALVEITVDAVILGAKLHACDIADARDAPVWVVPDDDILELPRICKPTQGLDIELECAWACRRRLIEDARGDLYILRLEGADDLAGGQVARGDLVGVKPDAHRIIPCPPDAHIADAI